MDWYLAIPWNFGIAAWLLARQRRVDHPPRTAVAAFLVGCGVVLILDVI
jgi:hypothetical protein